MKLKEVILIGFGVENVSVIEFFVPILFYFNSFLQNQSNGRESTVNTALDGSIYLG